MKEELYSLVFRDNKTKKLYETQQWRRVSRNFPQGALHCWKFHDHQQKFAVAGNSTKHVIVHVLNFTLKFETSAFESLYGGQFTLSTQLIKPNYLQYSPPTQHNSFLRNLPLCYLIWARFARKTQEMKIITISLLKKEESFYRCNFENFSQHCKRLCSKKLKSVKSEKSELSVRWPFFVNFCRFH